jgi:NADH dehydrogenase FAD-containing subunit
VNLLHLSDQERIDCLTFCIIGAGPTGIEFATKLHNFVEQDAPKYYPALLQYICIKVIEALSAILAPFEKSLQDEAVKQMNCSPNISYADIASLLPKHFKLTELLLDSSIKEVTAN